MNQNGPDPRTVNTRPELAAALTALRLAAGLTVRELARRINGPSATLGGYFSGRHVPGTAQVPLLTAALVECGVRDDDDIARWLDAVRRARTSSDRRVARPPAPYRGLHSYEPEDADLFFGRTTETQQILARVAALVDDPGPGGGVLVVVGPSGSGKSSLLRAGVAATVRGGALDAGRRRWSVTVTSPTDSRAETLDRSGSGPTLVIVDQFEEIFTSVPHRRARQDLLRSLTEPRSQVVTILGMRADFYADAAREPLLLTALQQAQVLVGPMSLDDVREAILAPATRAGISVEDGLADLVLADLVPRDASGHAHDAGALPLLSHALLATWDLSNGHRMTIADYRATGGIDAAVQRTAEDLFARLSAAERDVARRLFLRLVHIDDDVAVTRRRVTPDELARLVADGVDVQSVVDRFVGRRLITASDASVEISHEALLSAWPRLREWVDADRAGLRLHRQVTDAAKVWDGAGRDPGALLRGARLEAAAEWSADGAHRAAMDRLEVDFVDSGVRLRRAEATRERRRGRRLRRLLIAVAVLAVLSTVLAVLSFRAYSTADREQIAATAARNNALSRQIAIESQEVEQSDPALAQQLALAAYRIAPTAEARGAVIDRSVRAPMTRLVGAQGPTPLALSPDGHTIAVADAGDGSVHLYSSSGSTPPAAAGRIPKARTTTHLFALAFSPDGNVLATGGQDMVVRLWDVRNVNRPRALARLPTTFTGAIQSLAISPDGRTLAAASTGPNPVLEWDVTRPAHARELPGPRRIAAKTTMQSVAFDPHSTLLAAGGSTGVYVWPAARPGTTRPHRAPRHPTVTVDAVLFDPTGHQLYSGDKAGVITRWDVSATLLRTAQRIKIDTSALVNVLAVSPDGRQLTAGSSDNSVRQWTVSESRLAASTGLPGPVTGVQYSPDGRYLFATAADGTLRRWQAAQSTIPITGTAFTVGYAARGSRLEVATSGEGGSLRMWDTHNPSRPTALSPPLSAPMPVVDGTGAIRYDARLAAAADPVGDVELWDVADPRRPRPMSRTHVTQALPEQLAFSPDGNLLGVASDDHTITLLDVRDPAHPRVLARMAGRDLMLNVAFSPNGRFVAGANADSRVYLWDISRPAHPRRVATLTGFSSYAYGVAFSPNGKLLAATSADHTTRLWDVASPTHPVPYGRPLVGPTNYVYSAAFAPDSRTLAVASDDSTVRLYDVHERWRTEPIATLRELGENAFAVAFAPDGQTLVGGGRSDVLDLWTVHVGSVARSVCAVAGDPITRAEWAQYVPQSPYDPPCRDRKPRG